MNTIKVNKDDVIYVDMDGVLVQSGESKDEWANFRLLPGFLLNKKPIENAIEAFNILSKNCNVYILSTPVWDNVDCWSEKRIWVEKYLGHTAKKKLILTHNKALNKGKILIDDSLNHGANNFEGIHILFGSDKYPNWTAVLNKFEFL